MGLPFAPGVTHSWYAQLIKNRFLLMMIILFFAWKYYHRQFNAFTSILITFSAIFGLSGICPQYLMWLIPFMLIRGVYRLCGIYTLCTTIFFVFFYTHPLGNPAMPYQNMLAFSSLTPYNILMPSQAFMKSIWPTLIQLLGSLIIPLSSLATALYVYFRTTTHCLIKPIKGRSIPLYLLLTPLGATLIAELCRYSITPWHQKQFDLLMSNPLARYSVTTFDGKVAAHYLENPCILNAPTILISGALLWILACFLYSRKML